MPTSEKITLTKQHYNKLIESLIEQISSDNNSITDIIAVARGGFYPSQEIAYALEVPRIFSFGVSYYETTGQNKRKIPVVYQTIQQNLIDKVVLIIDDIFDSGNTLKHIKKHLKNECGNPQIITATVILKHNYLKPDYYAQKFDSKKWIVFPYE